MAIPRNLGNLAPGVDTNGVLGVTKGGTGATTLTANSVLVGNGTSALLGVAPGANGNVLVSNGTTWTSAAPVAAGAPIGALQYFQGTTTAGYPGSDWLQCNGGVVLQATYPTLYSRIGLIPNGGTSYAFQAANSTVQPNTANAQGGTSFTGLTGIRYLIGGRNTVTNLPSVATSTDAVTWSTATVFSSNNNITSAKYLNGTYFAAGESGLIATSTNAQTWNRIFPNPAGGVQLNDIIYGTLFVLGANNGNLYTSTNGTSWTARTSNVTGSITALGYNAALTNGRYVLGTDDSPAQIASSTDGITWTTRSTGGTINQIRAIGVAPSLTNRYVFGGDGGTITTSTDGVTWTTRSTGTSQRIQAITFGAGRYAYCADSVYGSSTDGVTWTAPASITGSPTLGGITFGNNLFVMSAAGGQVFTSTDAITWSPNTTFTYNTIVYNSSPNLYVVGGNTGTIRTSTNASTWTTQSFGVTNSIFSLTYGDKYVAVGDSGTLRTSTDAVTWTARTSGTTNVINGVVFNNGAPTFKYLYTCSNASTLGTSTDGITWSTYNAPSPLDSGSPTINCATANNVYFIWSGTGSSGTFKFSTDGLTWGNCSVAPIVSSVFIPPHSIVWDGTRYVMTGANMVGFSTNGINWNQVPLPFTISSLNFRNGVYFGMSSVGIVSSTDALNWQILNLNNYSSVPGRRQIAVSDDFIVACGSSSLLSFSNLFTYNKTTEFALPSTIVTNPATGTDTLFIRAT